MWTQTRGPALPAVAVYLYYNWIMSKPSPSPSAAGAPQVRLAWALAAQLGEGPAWIGHERALWFVDIEGRRLHRFDPATGAGRDFPMPGRCSFVLPSDDGALVVGMELALHRVVDGGLAGRIAEVGGNPRCRTNDATVDPRGRLWFGTMDLGQQAPIGQVQVFDRGALRAVGGQCAITNGPAISPDGGVLYHVDTLGGIVWEFDISAHEALVGGREFVRIAPGDGYPDGVTVDAQGCVWVALWGGWCVRRYAPGGELLLEVPMPCAQVTKLAFGGDGLRTAFVTTARTGLDAGALRAQPLAGALFAFDAPAPGLPMPAVALR